MSLHPQEALLQQARELQRSEGFTKYSRRRVVVEHRLARLVQLGMRQARYFGQARTLFQLLIAADCGKPDAGGGQGGCDGRRRVGKPLSVLSPVSRRHIKDLVE